MDGSPEYLENSDDDVDEASDGDMETEEEIIVLNGWPSNWPKELINHPVELGDRIIAAQSMSTPPKVCPFVYLTYMPHLPLSFICLSHSCLIRLIYLPSSIAAIQTLPNPQSHGPYPFVPFAHFAPLFMHHLPLSFMSHSFSFPLSQISQLVFYQSHIQTLFGDMTQKEFKSRFLENNDSLIFFRHYRLYRE